MKSTKIISFLKSLSATELKEFRDYVSSPFFNKNKKIAALLEILRKEHPDFNNSGITDELLHEKIFPGQDYDYFRIKNLTSDLLALGKDFLAHLFYRDESVFYPTFLLEKLREKNLDPLVKQSFKTFSDVLSASKIKDEFYLLKQSELSQQKHFFAITKDPLGSHSLFQDDFDNFLEYTLLRLLKFYCIMIHDKVQMNIEFDMKMFENVKDFLKSKSDFSNPTLVIYSNILELLTERTPANFFRLKELKKLHSHQLSREDRYMLDLYMSSFCAEMFNDHCRTDFQREHFLISKEQFERDEMTVGRMLYPDFMIHVKIAVRADEFEWAKMFMSKYEMELPEDIRQTCINFCNAYISYRRNDFAKSLELLSKSNFKKALLKTQVKILLLQCYVELGYLNEAFSFAESFRKFLERDKEIVSINKKWFLAYIKAVIELLRLMQLGERRKQKEIAEILLRESVNGIGNLFGIKLWLREKLMSLL